MMPLIRPLALLGAATLLSIAAPAGAFELKHSDGTLSLAAPPQKVVSFDLGVLDTLSVFDVPVAGVPKSKYEGSLAQYDATQKIGTLFEPDYPALQAVQPDLIIASGRSQKAVPELNEIAPTVSFGSDPRSFMASFRDATLALGSAFGKDEQAAAALASIEKNIEALHTANKGKTAAVLFTIRGNVIPHAPGDRFGYAYELTGTESVLPAKDPNQPASPRPEPNSPEARKMAEERSRAVASLAAAEPDWLLVLDRGAINGGEKTAAETLAKHAELSQTRAFKDGRVIYLDPNGWYVVGGGLNNLKNITDTLLTAMK